MTLRLSQPALDSRVSSVHASSVSASASGRDRIGDLDGLCTCDSRPGAKAGPGCRLKASNPISCDGVGGRDEGSKRLVRAFAVVAPDAGTDVAYENAARSGVSAVLIEVADYNGTPNDPSVTVSFFAGAGLSPPTACDGGTVGDAGANEAGAPNPAWGGCDVWRLQAQSLIVDRSPIVFTKKAWVNDGVLVASFEDVAVPLRIGWVDLSLNGAIVTARLASDSGAKVNTREDGVIAGRALGSDFIRVYAEQDIFGVGALCESAQAMSILAERFCPEQDLSSSKGAEASCDSIAVTFGFSATQALKGPITNAGAAQPRCNAASIPVCP